MELPSFDILWTTSEKLSELETALDVLDRGDIFKNRRKRRRKRGGLYGIGFDAEDEDHYKPVKICCDLAFYTNEEYERHFDAHVKCPVETCPFTAHPKAMRVHKEVVHDSGRFNDIYRETSTKSVTLWREARRRNYPTIERKEAKERMLEKRINRGQIFQTLQFSTLKRKSSTILTTIRSTTDSSEHCQHNQLSSRSTASSVSMGQQLPSSDCGTDVFPYRATENPGTFSLVSADYNSDSSQSSVTKQSKEVATANRPVPNGSKPASSRKRLRRKGRRRKLIHKKDSDYMEEVTVDSDESSLRLKTPSSNPFASHPIVKLQAQRRQCMDNINRLHSRPTLLQMLLAEDIRRERNQLMQCIRFIVKRNFFEKPVGDKG